MSVQFALNTAATAMENGQRALLDMMAIIARESFHGEHDKVLRHAVKIRAALQSGASDARKAAIEIHNARVREQRATKAATLSEITYKPKEVA